MIKTSKGNISQVLSYMTIYRDENSQHKKTLKKLVLSMNMNNTF